jgi:YidC/Oxa1 family membrane protein insertase
VGDFFGPIGYFFNIIFTFPIYNLLMLLDHVVGDFGLSIIFLTLIIRLCLVPLTLKQLRSMKATQAIQPLMAELKVKYAGDQQGQYRAMQELYKEYGVNPMAGCFPLLLQMPILYGMFGAMRIILYNTNITAAAVNLYIYPFLPKFQVLPNFNLNWFAWINPHWVISLAHADPTHILPILAGLATFAQLRMSQARAAAQQPKNTNKKADATADMTQSTQKMMSLLMPFVTFFFALNFPAGMALYWTTSSTFGMVQQYFVTGWGSLFISPIGKDTGTKGNDIQASKVKGKTVDSTVEVVHEADEASYNKLVNDSSSRPRRRPNSASARRRGSTTSRRNPSRS